MGLDGVELVMSVEEAFDFEFSDPEVEKIATVGEFYEAVWEKVRYKEQFSKQEVKDIIKNIIVDKTGVKFTEVVSNAHLVYDLGIE